MTDMHEKSPMRTQRSIAPCRLVRMTSFPMTRSSALKDVVHFSFVRLYVFCFFAFVTEAILYADKYCSFP